VQDFATIHSSTQVLDPLLGRAVLKKVAAIDEQPVGSFQDLTDQNQRVATGKMASETHPSHPSNDPLVHWFKRDANLRKHSMPDNSY
jgi:hypothetical protein